jgi:hypothetical protein
MYDNYFVDSVINYNMIYFLTETANKFIILKDEFDWILKMT